MEQAQDRLASGSDEMSGYDALQHSTAHCADVDGSSTAVIALLRPPNVLEVGALS